MTLQEVGYHYITLDSKGIPRIAVISQSLLMMATNTHKVFKRNKIIDSLLDCESECLIVVKFIFSVFP